MTAPADTSDEPNTTKYGGPIPSRPLGLPFRNPAPIRAIVAELFATQRSTDPIGVRIHEALAIAAVFLAGWPTTWLEFTYGPVLICAAVRLTGHIRVPGPMLWDKVMQLLLTWIGLLFLSLAWTPAGRHAWVGDIQSLRFVWIIPSLYMVSDRRPALIAALVLGIACGQLSQASHALGHVLHVDWMTWHRDPGRNSGWWDPVVGASILCAGLGLHLAACVLGTLMWERAIGAAGLAATLVCILITGTRGAWIGAALLVGISVVIAAVRSLRPDTAAASNDGRTSTSRTRWIGVAAVIVLVGAIGAVLFATPALRHRVEGGYREVERVIESHDYSSDTGMRLAAWQWAVAEFKTHPIAGVGAGGFTTWPALHAKDRPDLPKEMLPHAHSAYLHALATTGMVGFVLLFGSLGWAAMVGLRDPDTRRRLTGYAAGPALALVGLLCAGLFDTIQVNQQTANMMFVLVALCLPSRAPVTNAPWRLSR